ncbi:MAG: hypothetical protein CSB02_00300 [Bacteroidia bacterium]|nr:MAG: hypothetical protein CSB02_00300 [Bacteroidia bacterium]
MKRLLLLGLFMLSCGVFAQNLVQVDGRLITSDKKSAENISVALQGTSYGALADAQGYFSFKAKPGRYRLVVFSIAYDKVEMPVHIKAGAYNRLRDIELKATAKELEEVVVTGTRTEKSLSNVPILTKMVTEKEIEQTGSATALEAIESAMPGIQFAPDAHGDNMTIQGLDNKYILVLVDGERMIGEARGNVNFDRIAAGDIQQIEIVSGASSVLYGSNAIGGVINIITKKAKQRFEGRVSSRYSNFNTWRNTFNVGTKSKKFRASVNGFRNTSDGYDLTPNTPESFTVSPYKDHSLTAKLGYQPIENLGLSVHGTYFRHESFHPEKSLSSRHNLSHNYTLGGKAVYNFNDKHSLAAGVNADKFDGFLVYEKYNDSTEKISDYRYKTFTLTDTYQANDQLEFISGAELNTEYVFSDILFGHDVDKSEQEKRAHDFNLFTQVDWKIISNVEVIGGLRYTKHSAFGNHFTPNISAMYSLANGLKFRGTAAVGYKSPSLKELYYNFDHQGMFWIFGNKDLKPENSHYTSLSAEYTYKLFNVSVSLYNNLIDNKIEMVNVYNPQMDRMELHHRNISKAHLRGVEAHVNWKFLSNFKAKVGYVFSDAIDKSTGFQISGNSKHTGTMLLTYFTRCQKFPFSLTLSGKLLSPRLYEVKEVDANGEETVKTDKSEAYSIWKITYMQNIIPGWQDVKVEFRCGVNNIFDYSNLERAAVLNPGRTFWVGLAVKW